MKSIKESINIVICDDQTIVCEGLRAIFASVPNIDVIGIANDGYEAIELVENRKPDLVLMDLKMPEMDGIQATGLIKEKNPEVFILILTTFDTEDLVINAIRNGADGYILKDTPRQELIQTIIGTVNGQHHIDPHVAGKVLNQIINPKVYATNNDQKLLSTLNDREREILQCLGKGYTNTEISETLFLTEGTVKNYVSAILSKLGVTDRTQAALFAARNFFGN